MSCQKAEAVGFLRKQHGAQVAVAEAHLAVFGNRAGNAESLQADSDRGSRIGRLGATLLQRNRCTYRVSPYRILKADRLSLADDLVTVDSFRQGDFLARLDRRFSNNAIDFCPP